MIKYKGAQIQVHDSMIINDESVRTFKVKEHDPDFHIPLGTHHLSRIQPGRNRWHPGRSKMLEAGSMATTGIVIVSGCPVPLQHHPC